MARPKKSGLSYFPQDTDIYGDRKIRRLLNEHGSQGFLIYHYLLCLIYRDNGYWIQYDDELCFDIADYLKSDITEGMVDGVVNSCIKYNLFDQILFETSNVLTSSGIQKRYVSAKRGAVIDDEIAVTDVKTNVSAVKTPDSDAISTQSKVKESIVDKSKVKNPKGLAGEASSPDTSNSNSIKAARKKELLEKHQKEFYNSLVPFLAEYGKDLLKEFYNYWSEPNPSGTKMLKELQRTWDNKRRLETWKRNSEKFDGKQPNSQPGSAQKGATDELLDLINDKKK